MSISCNCDYDGDISWYYQWSYNFKPLATQRAKDMLAAAQKATREDPVLVAHEAREGKS